MSFNNYISVGIDVGSAFSWMSIVDPNENVVSKPFKITHNNLDSLNKALLLIKKAEELYSLKSHTFLESTGIYHFPLFCFLIESGFEAHIINPLISHSIKNIGIRKVKNDKIDSLNLAKLGLRPNLKTSSMPVNLVLELRSLTRKYYDLVDTRSGFINKLKADLSTAFPQYLSLFSNVICPTSLMILKKYPTPDKIIKAKENSIIENIRKTSNKGIAASTLKHKKLIEAAKSAKIFGCQLDSVYFNIQINISIIENLNQSINTIMSKIEDIVDEHKSERFVKQINLVDSIPGIGFLTAVTIMCEIGDFSAFANPKQLFAYFGLDPAVKESGKFKATDVHMSKRGSAIARRAIFSVALSSIRTSKNGIPINSVLLEYYKKKVLAKAKKVAIGAVMHKVCNLIFAVLRDKKPFELRTPEQHSINYQRHNLLAA